MQRDRVIVIGAGVGGLAAAVDLARSGADVTVLERAAEVGGKMRQIEVAGAGVDAGPTVFTMRWIFERLFADAGANLQDRLDLTPADILARHAWRTGERLDLFADIDRSADAISAFAGPREAQGFRDFCARSADIYKTLVGTFIAAERPTSPFDLVSRVGLSRLDALWRTAPMKSMWGALAENFQDPRLRQLFGRYATYVGSSPMLAPATLMLVAHVEQDGVWMVKGGMRRLAQVLRSLAEQHGALFQCGAHVSEILVSDGRATGVALSSGERLNADAIVFNGDVSALEGGMLGPGAERAAPATPRSARSLSAITWCLNAATSGFPLVYHNVFFAEDYPREFTDIFRGRKITEAPTVYICAQDRDGRTSPTPGQPERLLVLVNAPADGDSHEFETRDLADVKLRTFALLQSCGLHIDSRSEATVTTTPAVFNGLFPATGGALYGRASHGPTATFQRSGSMTRIEGLYLAGGSVHPGPGVPMAAMSGRLAAARLLEDRAALAGKRKRRSTILLPAG
jgi:1-hydroxycarotenoid 3,4-desaturase